MKHVENLRFFEVKQPTDEVGKYIFKLEERIEELEATLENVKEHIDNAYHAYWELGHHGICFDNVKKAQETLKEGE